MLAMHVTPADVGDRAEAIQAATDQGYTGEKPEKAAVGHGIRLEVAMLPEARLGFVLLPRRWVIERSFAWTTWFRRLVRDYERCAKTLADLHLVAFAYIMLKNVAVLAAGS
ncbi:transposase [Pseudochelatococcus contaminans]|uniref:Transposase n=1 Tax=Pseudochelatococcus contaminans TaxID=1538103 RepID=A0A7W6EHK8_9HYPH|nr:transposase [Pseudochelatococcus contaminans]